MSDLVHHVGGFCGFWTHVLCDGSGRPKGPFAPEPGPGPDGTPPDPVAMAGWIADVGDALVAELRATDPDTETWSWFPDGRTASFVARRCAHELAIHRYDAEVARGQGTPIPTSLAVDGVDELLGTLALARGPSGAATGQTLHVHGTDPGVDAEWMVTLGSGGVEVSRAHGRADLALRGPVGDLELVLYHRPPTGPVEELGDPAVLDAWYREFSF
jgi:uncharacterized protein (TIGR03083 family)